MKLAKEDYKGGFNTENLYYQSIWWLNKDSFGHSRLMRDVADSWLNGRFEHGGHKFVLETPQLTDQELEAIPGAKASLGALDGLTFKVLERQGSKMVIKQDEHKFWTSQGGDLTSQYQELREKHEELIGRDVPVARAAMPADSGDPPAPPPSNASDQVTLESLSKLEQDLGIENKVPSEIGGIEVVLAKDGSIWLLGSNEKHIPKNSQIGGFGTGQYVPESDGSEGVAFSMPSDSTTIQLDEASFGDGQGITHMSLFKLLVRAEREKGITSHSLSFLNITRKQEVVEAGTDGFDVAVKSPMKFKCLRDPRASGDEKITCKNIFAKAISKVESSHLIGKAFRFRFERVGQTFKIQRPYVITKQGISISKDKPVKISKD